MVAKFDNSLAAQGPDFGTAMAPNPVKGVRAIHINHPRREQLGLDAHQVEQLALARYLPKPRTPFAMVYAGHQFGGFSQQLGDGRGLPLDDSPWQQAETLLRLATRTTVRLITHSQAIGFTHGF